MSKLLKSRPRRAFTLVEILIVIAIILVLIALLLPVARKIRRRVVIMTTPIASGSAMMGVDALNARGTVVELSPLLSLHWSMSQQGPAWSPNGSWLAHISADIPPRSVAGILIMNPATGVSHRHRSLVPGGNDRFSGWVDDQSFVEIDTPTPAGARFLIRNAQSGKLIREQFVPGWQDERQMISPVPANTGAFYVTAFAHEIRLLRKDFSTQKTLHVDTLGGYFPYSGPKVDPFGEFVAWTVRGSHGWQAVGFKPLNAPSMSLPNKVGEQYQIATFCDWTEDGKILAAVYEPGRGDHLVILDRDNRLIADIPGRYGPAHIHSPASWRHFMRR